MDDGRDSLESKYPAVSALASVIEAFKEPLRVLEKKFTRSEMFLTAWRSQELSHAMKASMKDGKKEQASEQEVPDLSKMTGPQAVAWLNANAGFNIMALE